MQGFNLLEEKILQDVNCCHLQTFKPGKQQPTFLRWHNADIFQAKDIRLNSDKYRNFQQLASLRLLCIHYVE